MIEIPLNAGKTVLIDEVDIPLINRYKWRAVKGMSGVYENWYAEAVVALPDGRRIALKLHRLITSATKNQVVDHRDHDGLNNTRENLRACTRAQNSRNQRMYSRNTSGFTGVTRDKRYDKWIAQVKFEGKNYFLGYYTDAVEAAKARDIAAKELFGEFAHLNFPEADDGHT